MSGRRLQRAIIRILEQLLAPGVCLGCGCDPLGCDSLCVSCRQLIERVPNPCQYCGQPNPLPGLVCPACRLNPPRWQKLIAPLQYRGLTRDYLLQLKYSEALHLAKTLGRLAIDPFRQSWPRPEALLPVPLHRNRLIERGFNQAQEIAQVLSIELDIPIDRRSLTRQRDTAVQSGLSAQQRGENIRQAFTWAPRRRYRHVAVVDDIVTTGATVTEIAALLHRQGVEFVEVWALARACRL